MKRLLPAFTLLLAGLAAGCDGSNGAGAPPCEGEDCGSVGLEQQVVRPHICDFSFVDMSARGHTSFVSRLRDPLTTKVFLSIQPDTPRLRQLLDKNLLAKT